MNDVDRHSVIIGAGIAGLSAAIALDQKGISVQVVESRDAEASAGSAVVLWPNGTRILHNLGLKQQLADESTQLAGVRVHRMDGQLIGRTDLSSFGTRCGAPVVAIGRSQLKNVLTSALPPNTVCYATEARNIRSLDDGICVDLGEVISETADFLVLASGAHCAIRDNHIAKAAVRNAGVGDWLGLAPLPLPSQNETWEFIGPGIRAGFIPLPSGATYFRFTCRHEDTVNHDQFDRLQSRFGGQCSILDEYLKILPPEAIHYVQEFDMAPLPHWSSGRVIAIGDCAHAMTPALGQGANQSLVDAWTLSELFSGGDDTLRSLSLFEKRRMNLANSIVRQSAEKTALFLESEKDLMDHWYDDMERLDSPEALSQLFDICKTEA